MSDLDGPATDPGAKGEPQAVVDLARTHRALRMLRGSNGALIHATDEDALLQEVCRIAVDDGGYRMAMVAFAERDEAKSWRPAAYGGVEGAFVKSTNASWAEDSEYGRGPGATAVRTGQPCFSRDILNDPAVASWRGEALRRGYRSVVALPLKTEGLAFGVLAIHSSEVNGFDVDEIGILSELAGNLAFGILTLRGRLEHKRVEQALDTTETLYRSLFNSLAEGVCVQDASGQVSAANPAAERIHGRSAEQMLGRASDHVQWRAIHEDGSAFPGDLHPATVTLRTGEPQTDVVMGIYRPDASRVWISINSQPLVAGGESAPYAVVTTFRDITAHKLAQETQRRLNRELRAISSCNQTLLRARNEQMLLDEICRIVCDEAGYHMAWVGYREDDEAQSIRLVARGGADGGFLDNASLTWADTGFGSGPSGTAIRNEQSVWVQDIEADFPAGHWRDRALQCGFRSIISLPLKDERQRTFGVLVLYSKDITVFAADEMRLLHELSGDLAFGIVVLRTRIEHQRLEQQQQATLHFFASMDRINLTLQESDDLEQMMSGVLDAVLSTFACDRAWLLYPCDPESPTWRVPMERTRPEYPGASALGHGLPMDPELSELFRAVLSSPCPLRFGAQSTHQVPGAVREQFGVQSMLCMAIYPPTDKPYLFGLHQCSNAREWTADDEKLLQEIGRRLADGLSSLLVRRELQHSEARLRDSLLRVQRLVESNVIGVFFWSRSGRISDANEAFLGLVGYSREELLSGQFLWTAMTPQGDLAADVRATEELRRTGTASPYETQLIHKNGRCIPVLIGGALLEGSQDNGVSFVLDLTERKQAEIEAAARRAAEASSRAKSEFLSRMSHELRTPLNAVLGFSQLLQADAHNRLTPQQLTQLEHVRGAGWHLLALINDLLDVSRIEIGQLLVQAQAVELGPLLVEALNMAEPLAQPLGVSLAAPDPEQPPAWVLADPIRLRQVLINLLSNAVKYNRRGGSVQVQVARDAKAVLIDVIDSGVGMTPDQLAHLYEPFNRLGQERGGVQGTGIGLVLTRQLVRLMDGLMDVDSEVGRGTRVRVSLPAYRGAEPGDAPPFMPSIRATLDDATAHAASPVGMVLYIEDNPVNQLLVEQLLARWSGVRLVQAEDGANGIELARSLRPDLVLLDMQLPDIDGFAVLDALRADPTTRDLTVVALSASAMPESVAQARAHGVADYWTKPLDFDRFLADMQRLLATPRR